MSLSEIVNNIKIKTKKNLGNILKKTAIGCLALYIAAQAGLYYKNQNRLSVKWKNKPANYVSPICLLGNNYRFSSTLKKNVETNFTQEDETLIKNTPYIKSFSQIAPIIEKVYNITTEKELFAGSYTWFGFDVLSDEKSNKEKEKEFNKKYANNKDFAGKMGKLLGSTRQSIIPREYTSLSDLFKNKEETAFNYIAIKHGSIHSVLRRFFHELGHAISSQPDITLDETSALIYEDICKDVLIKGSNSYKKINDIFVNII